MVNSPFAPARENSPPRRSPLPPPFRCQRQCQRKLARACSRRPLGRLPTPSGDGTQRTGSSRGAAGWRRTKTRGRTRHAIEECAARLGVAGLSGPATGRAVPDQLAASVVAVSLAPIPDPALDHPHSLDRLLPPFSGRRCDFHRVSAPSTPNNQPPPAADSRLYPRACAF